MPFELNPQQKIAVEAPLDRACRVLAGPGSGKTVVITRRIKYLLDNGIDPKNIIACTFSRNMADELLERTIGICPEVRDSPLEKRISSIHAICYRVLRAEGETRKVAKNWQIKKAIEEAAERQDLDVGWKSIYYWICLAKTNAVRPGGDERWFRDQLVERGAPVWLAWKLSEIRREFDRDMEEMGLLTFSDMLYGVEILFEDKPNILKKWQSWTHYVLVDEFQDTSHQAMRILTLLAAPQNNLMGVGDNDQEMYRFAGATPEANLGQGFEERYPDGLTFKLETNYRSTRKIVDRVNELISHNYHSENRHLQKTLVPREGVEQGVSISWQQFLDCQEESNATVSEISQDIEANGRTPGDYFVGVRTRAQTGWLEGPLVRARIPFVNLAGGSFWASTHVADVIAYARLVYDRLDDDAFQRAYNIASVWMKQPFDLKRDGKVVKEKGEYSSHRWLGGAFLDKCNGSYDGVEWAIRSRDGWRWRDGVSDLEEFLRYLDNYWDDPSRLISEIIDKCYRDYLADQEGLVQSDEAENGKLEDLYTVSEIAGQFDNLGEFLDSVAQMISAAEKVKEDGETGDYLILSTVHRLKGMERPITYGLGISEGLLPHRFSLEPPPQFDVLPTGGMGRIDDERCVMFVLVSRAQEQVRLSSIQMYQNKPLAPSRFLSEMRLEMGEEEDNEST